ncbi:hypothetical protein SLE2022_351930 [Rubroshorea leprosula]
METLPSQLPTDSFYVSAPTSPGRWSLEYLCFYSAPTTPTRKALNISVLDHETEPGTPNTHEDANSNFDEFEFDTSQRFNINKRHVEAGWKSEQDEQKKSLPAMAFADELFCDGKVMPLMPLKPPPRLQYINSEKFDRQSSTLPSPKSPSGGLRLPFQRRSLWNDDFDPFMVALEHVRGAGEGKSAANSHRRARSMSPIGATSPQRSNAWENAGGNPIKRAAKSPTKLTEPKGFLFARRARLVKVDQGNPGKAGPTNPNRETGESTGKRIKRFLFRSTSTGKAETEKKQKQDPNSTETKPPEATKLTLTHYRPKLFLCVGSGSKHMQQ